MSRTPQTECVTPASGDMLFTTLETLPNALFVIDDDATTLYANASAQTITGARREDVCGKSLWRGAHQLGSAALYQAVRKTTQTRTLTEVEYVSPVTGTWLHVHLAPTVGGLMVQVHQESAAPQCQERFQGECLRIEDLDGLYDGGGILTPEGIVLEITEIPLAEVQIRREEVIGRPIAETPWLVFSPTSQEQFRAAIARASRGETVRFETVVHPREGLDRHLEVAITPHRDAEHHIAYLVLAVIDITERKRAEAEIHALIDAIPQIVWMARSDGSRDYYNRRWCDYTGLSPEQAQGDNWLQCIHPDDRQRVRCVWQHAVQIGGVDETELRLRQGTTGEYRWFLSRALPVRDETGQIIKWFGSSTDIEEQKRIEEALRQSQQRIRALIDSNIIGIVSSEGEEEQLVDANEAFLRMTGYSREDVWNRTLNRMKIIPPEQARPIEHALQELITRGQNTPFETELVCKDGSRLPVLAGGVLFQEHPRQTFSFVLDNSARKELERRKDDFIGIASHELKTPLTAVKMQVQLVRKRLETQAVHEAVTALARVEGSVKQLERLMRELLDVSKIQVGGLEYVWKLVDLDALLREIAETMQHTHPGYRILVHETEQIRLIGDRSRLEQVFTNLLSNAIKYSPAATTVEVDLSTSEDAITVRVIDHGLGIPREQRDKIFERFYRVAGPSQRAIPGLGMGLYIVAEIVKGHGGTITVDSDVGKGSTFTVTFPRRRDV